MLLLSGVFAIRRVPNPSLAILAVLLAGSIAGCDREKQPDGQAGQGQANVSAGQAKGPGQFEYIVDRSHKGTHSASGFFFSVSLQSSSSHDIFANTEVFFNLFTNEIFSNGAR
jgi:hypothetical protein